ncbi:uncharacterized protein V1516DRAFT_315940 [Lipomyces oligophaga]|uniref:uncharacterized protein n=1 Tax=Lipomyces oligophaga TaxID=45792 RepID=UPI0034CE57FF
MYADFPALGNVSNGLLCCPLNINICIHVSPNNFFCPEFTPMFARCLITLQKRGYRLNDEQLERVAAYRARECERQRELRRRRKNDRSARNAGRIKSATGRQKDKKLPPIGSDKIEVQLSQLNHLENSKPDPKPDSIPILHNQEENTFTGFNIKYTPPDSASPSSLLSSLPLLPASSLSSSFSTPESLISVHASSSSYTYESELTGLEYGISGPADTSVLDSEESPSDIVAPSVIDPSFYADSGVSTMLRVPESLCNSDNENLHPLILNSSPTYSYPYRSFSDLEDNYTVAVYIGDMVSGWKVDKDDASTVW